MLDSDGVEPAQPKLHKKLNRKITYSEWLVARQHSRIMVAPRILSTTAPSYACERASRLAESSEPQISVRRPLPLHER